MFQTIKIDGFNCNLLVVKLNIVAKIYIISLYIKFTRKIEVLGKRHHSLNGED